MDYTIGWMKSGNEGLIPEDGSEKGNWLGISPRTAALAVMVLLALVLGTLYLTGFPNKLRHAVAPAPYPHEQARITFAVGGDVIPHEPVRASAEAAGGGEQGWGSLLGGVDDVFKGLISGL